ncbi:MAG: hypothetical protein H6Q25_1352 [Bacteroidetes bacterium]|nr:hypothetical protein [Bacteroidota bacterium]
MKLFKITIFIFSIIAILTLISAIFPENGIKVGSYTFQFPQPEEILVRNKASEFDPEKLIEERKIKKIDSLQDELSDTLDYFIEAMVHPTSFYLPDNNYSYFDPFFKQAESAIIRNQIVRVLHYGDSQIELDRISSDIRTYFQKEYGGSGPGLLPLFQSVPTATINQNYVGSYTTYGLYGDGQRNKTSDYGLMAKSFKINGNGSFYAFSSSNSKSKNYKNITLLFYNENLTKASLNLNKSTISFKKEINLPGMQMFNWQLDTAVNNFSLQINGNPNIYGILVDGKSGVAVDNIPMRGASGTMFTQMNPHIYKELVYGIHVGMIILQYGGNSVPGLYNEKSADLYVSQLIKQIQYLKKLFPDIPILFIGPSDMATRVKGVLTTYPILPYLVDKLKKEVPANGAAFWNMYEVMGGKNSMLGWVKKGWAGSDYVHFTTKGANEIGSILVQTFNTMQDFYELRKLHPDAPFVEVYQKQLKKHTQLPK